MNLLKSLQLTLFKISQGRLISLILLVLACLTLYRIEDTPLAGMHAAQFDRYQRLMPRKRDAHPAVVVGIDSRSLAEFGQWPWPRERIAELIDRIRAGAPLVIGLDILFTEPDRLSPSRLAQYLPQLSKNDLKDLPDPDQRLAQALAASPSVLAVTGLTRDFTGLALPQKPVPQIEPDPATLSMLPRFPSGMSSLPVLEYAASGEGFINNAPEYFSTSSAQGVLRKVQTLALIGTKPFLSLPLEMVRVALGENGKTELEMGPVGISRLNIGNYSLPTLPNGELMLHFGESHTQHYVSAANVLAGQVEPGFFTSRLVLIGFSTSGLQDFVISPLGERVSGVDIHAQVIESLLSGMALQRPPKLAHLEIIALAISGLLLIGIVPAMRPRFAIGVFVVMSAFWIASGYAAFHFGRWLFDASSIVLLLAPVFMSLLSATWIIADMRQKSAERALQISREEAARINGELDAARRIQNGLLPDPAKIFAGECRYDVAALLEPARAVGGDYYDCFALDASRLCFSIADVSGKGLPASLFMAVAKTLTGALARRAEDIGQAMRDVEAELNRENPEFLFVTAFVGILNVETGRLDFVRAGHDAPLLLRAGKVSRIDSPAASGPPLCALGDFPYQSAQVDLQAGDYLCLFTDGVSEASNGETLFGVDRLIELFAAQASSVPAADQINILRDAVRKFEAGQAPADDLTLLLLRWHGPRTPAFNAH